MFKKICKSLNIGCRRCGSLTINRGYWTRGWNHLCCQAAGARGDRCYDCGFIAWDLTLEEFKKSLPKWCEAWPIQKKSNNKIMSEQIYESVVFKPLNRKLKHHELFVGFHVWIEDTLEHDYIRFTEKTIAKNPQVFDTKNKKRVFIEGAYYQARRFPDDELEVIKYEFDKFHRFVTLIEYDAKDFYEIGDQLKL